MSSKPINEMINRQGYKVIKVSDLEPFNLMPTDSLV